jgi:hypothetical protein
MKDQKKKQKMMNELKVPVNGVDVNMDHVRWLN